MDDAVLMAIENRLTRYLRGLVFIPRVSQKINKKIMGNSIATVRSAPAFCDALCRSIESLELKLFAVAKEAGTTNLDLTVTWNFDHLSLEGYLLLEVRST